MDVGFKLKCTKMVKYRVENNIPYQDTGSQDYDIDFNISMFLKMFGWWLKLSSVIVSSFSV